MAESNEMLKHHSELLSKNKISSIETIKDTKNQFIDQQKLSDTIKAEVLKNYESLVKKKIEICIQQIEMFANK